MLETSSSFSFRVGERLKPPFARTVHAAEDAGNQFVGRGLRVERRCADGKQTLAAFGHPRRYQIAFGGQQVQQRSLVNKVFRIAGRQGAERNQVQGAVGKPERFAWLRQAQRIPDLLPQRGSDGSERSFGLLRTHSGKGCLLRDLLADTRDERFDRSRGPSETKVALPPARRTKAPYQAGKVNFQGRTLVAAARARMLVLHVRDQGAAGRQSGGDFGKPARRIANSCRNEMLWIARARSAAPFRRRPAAALPYREFAAWRLREAFPGRSPDSATGSLSSDRSNWRSRAAGGLFRRKPARGNGSVCPKPSLGVWMPAEVKLTAMDNPPERVETAASACRSGAPAESGRLTRVG